MHTERCRDMDISFSREPDNTFIVRLGGNWNIVDGLPSSEQLQKQIGSTPFPERVAFDTRELGAWDSSLLTFLIKLTNFCRGKSVPISYQGLPEGVARLIDLASAVPEKKDARKESGREPFLTRVGEAGLEVFKSAGEMLAFIGEVFLAFMKLLRGKARFRRSDLTLLIQECGVQALPITRWRCAINFR